MLLVDLAINGWSIYKPLTTINETHGEIDVISHNNQFPGVQLIVTINLDAKFVKLILDYLEGDSYTWLMDESRDFPTAQEINEYATRLIKEA
jgi:hypothetical protein